MKQQLQAMLEAGRDSALLRFSLGEILLGEGDARAAAEHLARAVQQDPQYSAAWKLYGQAQAATGAVEAAIATFDHGIAVAEGRGDRQAAKEMRVFRKRAQKRAG